MILTDTTGHELRVIEYNLIDMDLNGDRNFEMEIPCDAYTSDLCAGARIFEIDTEFGGRIGGLETDSENDIVKITGMTWRGILNKKVLTPPTLSTHRVVTGDLNGIINSLISECDLGEMFVGSEESVYTITSYQFDRYSTLLEGINKMLESCNHKLVVEYVRGENGEGGKVKIYAKPVVDYSNYTEISQNNRINFTLQEKNDGINHLVCAGEGQNEQRIQVDLYVGADGSISENQYYTGIDEVAELYEYTSADRDTLIQYGRERLLELANYQNLTMSINALDFTPLIGDIVGGRDHVTGMYMKQPITNLIYREEDGVVTVQYVVEGES